MRKYTDAERAVIGAACHDCGLAYTDPGWIEAIVSDHVWEIINPTYHPGAGLLCITCIARRCHEAGLHDVPVLLCGVEPLRAVLDREQLVEPEAQDSRESVTCSTIGRRHHIAIYDRQGRLHCTQCGAEIKRNEVNITLRLRDFPNGAPLR